MPVSAHSRSRRATSGSSHHALPPAPFTSARRKGTTFTGFGTKVSTLVSGIDKGREGELLSRVRDSYLRQAASGGWLRLDGERSKDAVAADVITAAGVPQSGGLPVKYSYAGEYFRHERPQAGSAVEGGPEGEEATGDPPDDRWGGHGGAFLPTLPGP